jgi:hypothetical protein
MLQFEIKRTADLAEEIANKDPERIFTLQQAADYIGVTKQWVSQRKDRIGFFQESNIIRIKKSAIDKYLDQHTVIKKK